MIFCFDAFGNSLGVAPERVYQGSNGSNKLYFLCPVDERAVVNVKFAMPNHTSYGPVVLKTVKGLEGLFDKTLTFFNAWEIPVDAVMTSAWGKVFVQFEITLPDGTVIASEKVSYYVEKGVIVKTPEQGDSYQKLLEYVSSLSVEYDNVKDSVNNAKTELEQTKSSLQRLENNFNTLNEVVDKGFVQKTTLKTSFSYRTTANGLNVVDGVKTFVKKIYGKSTTNPGGMVEHACFKRICSYCANLFSTDQENYTVEGLTVSFDNSVGEITLNGTVPQGTSIHFQLANGFGSGNYTMQYHHVSGMNINGTSYAVADDGILVKLTDKSGGAGLSVSKQSPFASGYVNSGADPLEITIEANPNYNVIVNGLKFKIMLVSGIYTESNMPAFSLNKAPDVSFALPEKITLMHYDYIDVENQKIVRASRFVSQESPFTQPELETAGEHLLLTSNSLVEKVEESYQEISIPNGYIAYYGGKEICEEQSYALCEVEQEYYVKL